MNPDVQYIQRKGKYGGTLNMWPKGVSGNPKGRAKGQKTFKTLLNEMLDMKTQHEGESVTKKEKLTHVLISKGMEGNLQAITEIMDRLDGTPDSTGNNELIESLGAEGIGLIAELATRLAERKRQLEQAQQSGDSANETQELQALSETNTVPHSGE
jgi:microcystin degradation protein MlrC